MRVALVHTRTAVYLHDLTQRRPSKKLGDPFHGTLSLDLKREVDAGHLLQR